MLYELRDAFLSLLPARYRRPYQADPVSGTILSGILQALVAFGLYITLFIGYLKSFGAFSGTVMTAPELAGRNLYSTSFGLGVLGWLSFSLTPGPLLSLYFMIEGVVRTLAGRLTVEPLPSLPFWLAGAAHDLFDRWQARRRLPPPAPDIVEWAQPGAAWALCVTTVRPKPHWHSLVQIEYEGVHYVVASSGEEVVEGKACFRYYLRKATELEAFRGIVHYDPFEYWKNSGE